MDGMDGARRQEGARTTSFFGATEVSGMVIRETKRIDGLGTIFRGEALQFIGKAPGSKGQSGTVLLAIQVWLNGSARYRRHSLDAFSKHHHLIHPSAHRLIKSRPVGWADNSHSTSPASPPAAAPDHKTDQHCYQSDPHPLNKIISKHHPSSSS